MLETVVLVLRYSRACMILRITDACFHLHFPLSSLLSSSIISSRFAEVAIIRFSNGLGRKAKALCWRIIVETYHIIRRNLYGISYVAVCYIIYATVTNIIKVMISSFVTTGIRIRLLLCALVFLPLLNKECC